MTYRAVIYLDLYLSKVEDVETALATFRQELEKVNTKTASGGVGIHHLVTGSGWERDASQS